MCVRFSFSGGDSIIVVYFDFSTSLFRARLCLCSGSYQESSLRISLIKYEKKIVFSTTSARESHVSTTMMTRAPFHFVVVGCWVWMRMSEKCLKITNVCLSRIEVHGMCKTQGFFVVYCLMRNEISVDFQLCYIVMITFSYMKCVCESVWRTP